MELEDGECVFIPSRFIKLKIQEEIMCEIYQHGKFQPERCYFKVGEARRKKGWSIDKRNEGSFSYVEFFNIVSNTDLFEGAEEPRQFDDSFTHSCKMLVPDDYKPWSEIVKDPNWRDKMPVALPRSGECN